MERFFVHVFSQALFLGVFIASIAFVAWGFDPASWPTSARLVALFVWYALACVVAAIVEDNL